MLNRPTSTKVPAIRNRCVVVSGSAAVLAIAACSSDMAEIDRQVERLVNRTTARLDPTAATPRPVAPATTPPGATDKTPATINKPAAQLVFTPADEARDVSKRLNDYTVQSLGADPAPAPEPGTDDQPTDPQTPTPNTPRAISLEDAMQLAQSESREFKSAEEEYILAAIRLLIEKHRWTPRLANQTSLTLDGSGDNGRFENALRVINDLRVTQRLPFGGQAEASWVFNAAEQLRKQATSRYAQSSSIVLSGTIPLLKDAGLIAQEDLIQSERNLVYAARTFERFRRRLLVDVANDYFALVQTQNRITNEQKRLQNLRKEAIATGERVKAGRINAFERAIIDNQVLSAESSLAGLRDGYILQLDRFKLRLGLDVTQPIRITPIAFDVPEPDATLDDAVASALDYRLDLQNQRDQLDDSRRAIANARNQLLPDLNLAASATLPTDRSADQPGLEFDPADALYSASITLGLPIDKEIERLGLRQSLIALQKSVRDYEQARDSIVISVRAALRAIELARFQLRLAEDGVKIAERRREEQELKKDLVEPQKIIDSEDALVNARNARDQARTDLRNAVLNYLLESDQLRVNRDGSFEPLPGMQR